MKFQALLLFLIIIISVLFSPTRKAIFEKKDFFDLPNQSDIQEIITQEPNQEIIKETTLENPFSVFFKDFYSFFVKKINYVGKNIVFAAENFHQNITFVKSFLGGNFNDIFLKSQESELLEQKDKNNSGDNLSLSHLLVSKVEIDNSDDFFCDLSEKPDLQEEISSLTAEIILISYLNKSSDEVNSNEIIFKSNIEKRWPIASLTKLMTSVVALEKMDLEKAIIMNEEAINTEGTIGDFKVGEIFEIKDLIKAMLISSSNDVAVAITESFNEDGGNFINEMQRKAAELGMFSTTFLEPTGLSYINQSIAEDLVKLAVYIYFKHPEILEISRQKETIITELISGKSRKIFNINSFAGEEDFIGGKTGFIDEAGRNLIAFFEIDNKLILTITLGSENSIKETGIIKDIIKDCQ
ncbi:D-alanyl-D-alanine carboxypeptidase [Candidatus Wolfebacteria bacterium]|nr:D-alanyl-D-alanine carboxypeptidase [Candidatus Wolfebacteria bacterium]